MIINRKFMFLSICLVVFSSSTISYSDNSGTTLEKGKLSESSEELSCENDSNALNRSLQTGDTKKRRMASYKLGLLKCVNSLPYLVKALNDNDSMVRVNAAYALGEINNPEAIPQLYLLLNDKDEFVRLSSAEALGKMREMCEEAYLKKAEDRLIEIWESNKDKEHISPVIVAVVGATRYVGTERSVSHIIDILEKKQFEYNDIHIPALQSLGKIGNKKAIDYIKEYANMRQGDHLLFSRVKAIEILGEIGDTNVATELDKLSNDECKLIVESSLKSIKKIKDRNIQ